MGLGAEDQVNGSYLSVSKVERNLSSIFRCVWLSASTNKWRRGVETCKGKRGQTFWGNDTSHDISWTAALAAWELGTYLEALQVSIVFSKDRITLFLFICGISVNVYPWHFHYLNQP